MVFGVVSQDRIIKLGGMKNESYIIHSRILSININESKLSLKKTGGRPPANYGRYAYDCFFIIAK